MILQSLLRYYELLADDPDSGVARPGWSNAKVAFAAVLSPDGDLENLVSLKITEQRGKKTQDVPRVMLVPEQVKKTSGVSSNFLCENACYMFGLDTKGKPGRTLQCHEAFCALHQTLLTGIGAPEAQAVLSFLERWDAANAPAHPLLAQYLDELNAGANLVFRLSGGRFVHEVPEIRAAWERSRESAADTPTGQCLVCGERRPVARLHPSIKGVRDAQSTGASIVSFNARAYESFGKDLGQGLNAPVSEYAAFAYTTVLNRLLADTAHRLYFGDTTVVFWAESVQPIYRDSFLAILEPASAEQIGEEHAQDAETERLVHSVFEKIAQGRPVAEDLAVDPSVHFCVLGLAPNASRLSVRFFLSDTFGAFLEHIGQHYRDLMLCHAPFEPDWFPIWRLLSETVPPSAKEKRASPLLAGSVLRAILSGADYPEALYTAMLLRIRAEHQISYYKAAAIKGCLLRKARNAPNTQKIDREVLTVALNDQSDNKAYVLGRLFSVLEKLQQDANPGINATIRDRYFTSACAAPGTVFPSLLRLSSHHISKAQYGGVSDRRIEELLDKLPMDGAPFPAHLSLDEQGIFILGYYHQNKANYAKSKKEENAQ